MGYDYKKRGVMVLICDRCGRKKDTTPDDVDIWMADYPYPSFDFLANNGFYHISFKFRFHHNNVLGLKEGESMPLLCSNCLTPHISDLRKQIDVGLSEIIKHIERSKPIDWRE